MAEEELQPNIIHLTALRIKSEQKRDAKISKLSLQLCREVAGFLFNYKCKETRKRRTCEAFPAQSHMSTLGGRTVERSGCRYLNASLKALKAKSALKSFTQIQL